MGKTTVKIGGYFGYAFSAKDLEVEESRQKVEAIRKAVRDFNAKTRVSAEYREKV